MSLQLSAATMLAQGMGSPYASVADLYITDTSNASHRILDTARTTLSWSELPGAFWNIKAYQERIGVGFGGWGMDLSLLLALHPALYWFLGIMLVRYISRKPFGRFGIYMGVVTENTACHRRRLAAGCRGVASLSDRNQRKIIKFQNQMWLSLFYIVSSCFGYYVQCDQPWFKLPLDDEASLHLLLPHPYNPPRELLMYYHYGLAFYFAELCSLFLVERHVKRSDFLEYTVHHITTLLLIVCSHVGLEHRFGAYVLFIHDASDIMLSVSKTLHYMLQEDVARMQRYNASQLKKKSGKKYRQSTLFKHVITEFKTNSCFAVFIVLFFFFRLYCLPYMGKATIRMAAKVRHGNFNMWMLVFLLNVALQGLHVYWAILIIVMIASLVSGGERKDIRSEEDEDIEGESCVHWGFLTESDSDNDPENDVQPGVKNGSIKADTLAPAGKSLFSGSTGHDGVRHRRASSRHRSN